ncbi:MAG: carboxypeptidase-like regulatory domain-containing protein, partial [Acidobacteriota bacterium]
APASGPSAAPSGYGGTASVLGRVVDDQGLALPGVTLTLATAGLSPMVTASDARGEFRFLGLPAGTFSLQADLEGFSSVEYPSLRATSGRHTAVEMTLSTAVEDVITVTAESPLLDERRISTGATINVNEPRGGGSLDLDFRKRKRDTGSTVSAEELAKIPTVRDSFQELKQGLVGGVKPLPVAIPESGKALYLAGALPPTRVTLVLDVKAKRQ